MNSCSKRPMACFSGSRGTMIPGHIARSMSCSHTNSLNRRATVPCCRRGTGGGGQDGLFLPSKGIAPPCFQFLARALLRHVSSS
jgi:hypothetical protein